MAMSEIDSFIWKFRKLLYSGKNARLEIKSEAGKAVVTLTAEVDVRDETPIHEHHVQSRNGPARQRRREKRAAARAVAIEAAAQVAGQRVDTSASEKAAELISTEAEIEEEACVNHVAVKVKEAEAPAKIIAVKAKETEKDKIYKKDAEEATIPVIEVTDEFCPNDIYTEVNPIPTPSPPSAASAPPPPSRGLGSFDYYSMQYDDLTDSE